MKLPLTYDNYIFDLYGTLVDIHTDESDTAIWEKLAMFYGYYGALYEAKELKARYETLVKSSEAELKKKLEDMDIEKQNEASDAQFAISYAHEASPEIHIEDVFEKLYAERLEKQLAADHLRRARARTLHGGFPPARPQALGQGVRRPERRLQHPPHAAVVLAARRQLAQDHSGQSALRMADSPARAGVSRLGDSAQRKQPIATTNRP